MATSKIQKEPVIHYGIVRGSDIGDIPANGVIGTYNISTGISSDIGNKGVFVQLRCYVPPFAVGVAYIAQSYDKIVIRLQNTTSTPISKDDYEVKWMVVE